MVKCKECKTEMDHQYSKEESEKLSEGDPFLKLEYRRLFICPKCKWIKRLSRNEIVKEMIRVKLKSGASQKEIIEEVKKKKAELEEEFKN